MIDMKVRITHDPYAPGMVEKYGRPGETDNEGFDPYADSVGPGIYGGVVRRDEDGQVAAVRMMVMEVIMMMMMAGGGGLTVPEPQPPAWPSVCWGRLHSRQRSSQ